MTKLIIFVAVACITAGCSGFHMVKTGNPQAPVELIVEAGESGDKELVPGLQKLLQSRASNSQALDSEKTIETILAINKLSVNDAKNELVNLLKDEDEEVRYHAVEALGDVRDSDVVRALASSLNDEDDLVLDAVSRSLYKLTLTPIHKEDEDNSAAWKKWWEINSQFFGSMAK